MPLPAQSPVRVNGCSGAGERGGCSARTRVRFLFVSEQGWRGQMGGLTFRAPPAPVAPALRVNGCRGRGQKGGRGLSHATEGANGGPRARFARKRGWGAKREGRALPARSSGRVNGCRGAGKGGEGFRVGGGGG